MKNITYENQGTDTLLVYHLEDGEHLDSFAKGMLQNNEIMGVIRPTFQQRDTDQYLKYPVTSRIPLKDYLQKEVQRENMIKLCMSVVEAIADGAEYMLPQEKFLLNMDYVFVDVAKKRANLIFLPVDEFSQSANLYEFLLHLISHTCYDMAGDVSYVADLINCLNQRKKLEEKDLLLYMKKLLDKGQSIMAPDTEHKAMMPGDGGLPLTPPEKPFNPVPPEPPFNPSLQKQKKPFFWEKQPQNDSMPVEQAPPFTPPVPGKEVELGWDPEKNWYTAPPEGQPEEQKKHEKKGFFGRLGGDKKKKSQTEPAGFGEPNPPFGGNAPFGQPNPPFGVDTPPAPSFGENAPFGGNAPFGVTPPQQDKPFGVETPPSQDKPFGVDTPPAPPFGGNAPFGVDTPPAPSFGGDSPFGVNAPFGQPTPPFGGNSTPFGVETPPTPPKEKKSFFKKKEKKKPEENNQQFGTDNPFGGNIPFNGGNNAPFGQSTPPFGENNGGNVPPAYHQQEEGMTIYMDRGSSDDENKTVILGGGNSYSDGATVMMNQEKPVDQSKKMVAKITRRKNGSYKIIDREVFHIGREGSFADFYIADNPEIGSVHADIFIDEDQYFIYDRNSLNHTYVNGTMLKAGERCPLKNGDVIRLANEEFDFTLT